MVLVERTAPRSVYRRVAALPPTRSPFSSSAGRWRTSMTLLENELSKGVQVPNVERGAGLHA